VNVRDAIQSKLSDGMALKTPTGSPFRVKSVDDKGIILLFGSAETQTRITWECLDGVPAFLGGKDWVRIGGRFNVEPETRTLDGYLKLWIKRATAPWVAVALETAGLVEINRSKPARLRLIR